MENMCLSFENRMLGVGSAQKKLPLLLVTGFLGAGKTTLLRHLLSNKSNLRLAVLVNEIGTIDIDGALLKSKDVNAGLGIVTKELTNGCVCCDIKTDLRRAVLHVLERKQHLDYLVIETSGAADPRPVAADLHQLCRLDMLVTVVDASAVDNQLSSRLGMSQLAAADFVLLNKCDLVQDGEVTAAVERIATVTTAKVEQCKHGEVPLELLMDVQAQASSAGGDHDVGIMSHDGALAQVTFKVGGRAHFHDKSKHAGFQEHQSHHEHGAGSGAMQTVAFSSSSPLRLLAWQRFASAELRATGVVRVKGFLFFAEQRAWRYEVHVSGKQRLDIVQDGKWSSEPRVDLVIIGTDLESLSVRRADFSLHSMPLQPKSHNPLREMMAEDPNLELASSDVAGSEAAPVEHVVMFGVHQTDNMRLHGVYASDLNRQLVSMLNAARKPLLALPFCLEGSPRALVQLAVSDPAHVAAAWDAVREAAYALLLAKNVPICKCGL